MQHQDKKPELDSETNLERIAEDLAQLRLESERRLGRALSIIHHTLRQRERERRAKGAK